MHQYRIHVKKFMDDSMPSENSLRWYWVGEYHTTSEGAIEEALLFREVYANVRIVHQGEVWKSFK